MKCVAWFALVAALVIPAVTGAQGVEEKRLQIAIENSPSTGPAGAPVTIVEFIDFQ